MQHEEHPSQPVKGFGTNTNGLGILIVAVVAVCLALFCWNFWKDGSREAELYRLNSPSAHGTGAEHEQGEKPGETPAAEAGTTVAPSVSDTASQHDTMPKPAEPADTSHH